MDFVKGGNSQLIGGGQGGDRDLGNMLVRTHLYSIRSTWARSYKNAFQDRHKLMNKKPNIIIVIVTIKFKLGTLS